MLDFLAYGVGKRRGRRKAEKKARGEQSISVLPWLIVVILLVVVVRYVLHHWELVAGIAATIVLLGYGIRRWNLRPRQS